MGLGAGGRGDSRGNVVRHAAAEGFRSWQKRRGLLDRRAPSGGEGRLSGQGLRRAVREHGPAPPRRVGLQTFLGGGVTETSQKRQKPHCHGEILL